MAMKMRRRNNALTAGIGAWLLACLTAGLVTGCGTAASAHRGQPRRPAVLTSSQVSTLRTLSAGDTEFGLRLLASACHADPGRNVVLSPLSVTTGLGLAYLGARGQTARDMAAVMRLPQVGAATLTGMLRDRSDPLGTLDRPGVTFTQSSRIWADPTLTIRPSYVAELRRASQSRLIRVPLLKDPAQAAGTINAVVSRATWGHIPHLLPAGALDGATGWVLTNAMYLKAAWATPFNPAQTAPGQFSAIGGQVTANYLNGDGYPIASDGGWTAAALPYRGGRLTMIALLPPLARQADAGQLAGDGCPLPSGAQVATVESELGDGKQTAAIALPKVRLSWSGSLKQELIALGMGAAFAAHADFSGISPQACCIGFVQHAATLDVAEKGTVASAATAVGFPASAVVVGQGKIEFNRPYLMLIEDSTTGEPLMLAWVANPAAS
jgi:serpin B